MKKRNKMKLASLVLCGALLAGFVLNPASGSAAETVQGTGKVSADTATVDNPDAETNGLSAVEVPINASTNGSEIIYNINVTYGAMTFSYCYGRTWDPSTHTYSTGTVGWDPADLDGDNNKITVTNNSNYPVKATFSVADPNALRDAFNDTSAIVPNNCVRGNFSTNNTTFVSSGGNVTNQVAEGNVGYQPASISLEMDAKNLTTGMAYYRKTPGIAKDATDQQNTKSMYFALAGVPDKSINSSTEVGSIKVTIAPETGVSIQTA